MDQWVKLAEKFSADALNSGRASKNLRALSDICKFMSSSPHGRELAPSDQSRSGEVILIRRDGSFPTKSLRVMSLADDKIEFCLRDGNVERYFHPDEPNDYALDRFREVIRSIDWRKPVKPANFFENLSTTYKALFNKRYRR
jgi:hypothetical protein